jgi:hypothetical protein
MTRRSTGVRTVNQGFGHPAKNGSHQRFYRSHAMGRQSGNSRFCEGTSPPPAEAYIYLLAGSRAMIQSTASTANHFEMER